MTTCSTCEQYKEDLEHAKKTHAHLRDMLTESTYQVTVLASCLEAAGVPMGVISVILTEAREKALMDI